VLNVAQDPTISTSATERSEPAAAATGALPPRMVEKVRMIAMGISNKNKGAVKSVTRRLKESADTKKDIFAKKTLVPGNPITVRQLNHAAAPNTGSELPTPEIL
jgi:hypothetical protein